MKKTDKPIPFYQFLLGLLLGVCLLNQVPPQQRPDENDRAASQSLRRSGDEMVLLTTIPCLF